MVGEAVVRATEVVGATVAMGRRWPRAATETTAVLI